MALTRTLADGVQGAGILYLVIREEEKAEGKPKYPDWLPAKYRTLKVEARPTEPDSTRDDDDPLEPDEDDEPGWSELTDEIFALNRFKSTYVAEDLEENYSEVESFANSCSPAISFSQPETVIDEVKAAPGVARQENVDSTPISQPTSDTNNCSSTGLDLAELEEKIRRGFNLTRDFYECGRSLTLVRDHALYEPTFTNFEEYCEQRFGKSLRLAQYFMSAAVVVDNLLEAKCTVLPTAESQVRVIASLPAHQQVEIWQKACNESKGVPIASKVREVKAAVLGEPMPERTIKSEPIKLPNPSTLLHHLKGRHKGTKVSLKDVEVLLELIQELNYGNRE